MRCTYDADCCNQLKNMGGAFWDILELSCDGILCNRAGECVSSGSAGIFNSEYTFSAKDMVIMVLLVLNLVTMFAIFCHCLRSRNGGVARRSGKYQVVSMAGDSECEMMNNRAV